MIAIVPYNTLWPEEFKVIGEELGRVLGEKTLGIHHIGSTSVPGMPAKDIIDIQVTVNNLDIQVLGPLLSAGYTHVAYITCDHQPKGFDVEKEQLEKQFFKKAGRNINLHVRVQGRFNQQYPILFRDYLRNNSFAANAYAEIKRQLASYFPDNVQAYYDIKDPVCDAIMAGAYEWAKAVNWAPAISDIS